MSITSYYEDETTTVNPRGRKHLHNRTKLHRNRKSISKSSELKRITELPKLLEDKDLQIHENSEIDDFNSSEEFANVMKETDKYLQENCEIFLPKKGGYLERTLEWIEEQRKEALLKRDNKSLPDFGFITKEPRDSIVSGLQLDEKAYITSYSPSLLKINPPVKRSESSLRTFDTSGSSNITVHKKKAYEMNNNSKPVSIKNNIENFSTLVNMMNPKKYLEEMFQSPPRHVDIDKSSLLKKQDYDTKLSSYISIESPNKSLTNEFFEDITTEENFEEVVKDSARDNFPDFENFVINPIKIPEIKFYPRKLF